MCKISQLAEKNTGQLAIRRAYRTGALFFIIRAYLTLLLRLTKRVVIVLSSFPTEDALFNCVEGKAHDTREINCGWREPKSFYEAYFTLDKEAALKSANTDDLIRKLVEAKSTKDEELYYSLIDYQER